MAPTNKLTAKEKLEKQREQARERQRKRRAKLTEEELEKKRQYDRSRYVKEKQENKKKSIREMTEREKRKVRKQWREQYLKKKEKKASMDVLPDEPVLPNSKPAESRLESNQKKRGRKAVRKDRSAAYRKIAKQTKKIEELERRLRKYKKRLERQKKTTACTSSPSPRKMLTNIVGRERVSPKIKKQLFVGLALQKQLEKKAKHIRGKKKDLQKLRKEIGFDILKKYRVQSHLRQIVPYKSNKNINNGSSEYTSKKRMSLRQNLTKQLLSFYEDDNVSRLCPGKKDKVKKKGTTRQRRVLLDTLKNLHRKFQEEYKSKISLASFRRSRPFWVTFPKRSDRETRACVKHENFSLMVQTLRSVKAIKEKNISEVMRTLVCSDKKIKCMFGNCEKCKGRVMTFSYDQDFKVKSWKWANVNESKIIKNKERIIKKNSQSKICTANI